MNGTGNIQDISANSVPAPSQVRKGAETFVHKYPATAVTPAWECLSVRHGLNIYPVAIFEGRQCYTFNSFRCFGGKGRNYHNRMQIKFLDTGELRTVPAGEWAKKAKNP